MSLNVVCLFFSVSCEWVFVGIFSVRFFSYIFLFYIGLFFSIICYELLSWRVCSVWHTHIHAQTHAHKYRRSTHSHSIRLLQVLGCFVNIWQLIFVNYVQYLWCLGLKCLSDFISTVMWLWFIPVRVAGGGFFFSFFRVCLLSGHSYWNAIVSFLL